MHAISVSLTTSVVFLLWRWQGGWEDDEDVHEAACREALEEAGVRGAINVCNCSLSLSFSLSHTHIHTKPHSLQLHVAPEFVAIY
jgi:8-oxo-dGTP pyrophosphatase MutT (NUDIX family)